MYTLTQLAEAGVLSALIGAAIGALVVSWIHGPRVGKKGGEA